jgi:hypothetical protein
MTTLAMQFSGEQQVGQILDVDVDQRTLLRLVDSVDRTRVSLYVCVSL